MSSLPADFDIKKMSDRNYKGEDFNINPELAKNPFSNRKCTDVLMGIFFAAFLGLMGFMTIYGYTNGMPGELLAPIDSNSEICGYSAGTENYPYLYIYDITSTLTPTVPSLFSYTTCIESCPNSTDTLVCSDQADCDGAYDRYSTYELMGYCIPVSETLPADV